MPNKDDVFENKNERNDFIISLVVIAVFIGFVFMIFKNGTTDSKPSNKSILITNTEIETKTGDTIQNNNTSNFKKTPSNNSTITHQTINKKLANSKIIKQNVTKNELQDTPTSEDSITKITRHNEDPVLEITDNNNITTDTSTTIINIDDVEDVEDVDDVDDVEGVDDVDDVEGVDDVDDLDDLDDVEAENKIETVTDNKVEKSNKTLKEDTLEHVEEVIEENKTDIETNSIEDEKEKLATKNCVIIVGAFNDDTNLNKTLSKLEQNGFFTTQGLLNNKGLKYVGVPIRCNENNVEKIAKMDTLNALFNITSWVYKEKQP